jgi:hypothetical protein
LSLRKSIGCSSSNRTSAYLCAGAASLADGTRPSASDPLPQIPGL